MIRKVLYGLLSADSSVTDLLATYQFGDGDAAKAAIFTGREIPDDAEYPAIWIQFVGGTPFGCRGQRGADLHCDIHVNDDRDRSGKDLDELAMAVWLSLDRADLQTLLAAEGYDDWGCRADPPVMRTDVDGYPGYNVRVHCRVLKDE